MGLLGAMYTDIWGIVRCENVTVSGNVYWLNWKHLLLISNYLIFHLDEFLLLKNISNTRTCAVATDVFRRHVRMFSLQQCCHEKQILNRFIVTTVHTQRTLLLLMSVDILPIYSPRSGVLHLNFSYILGWELHFLWPWCTKHTIEFLKHPF